MNNTEPEGVAPEAPAREYVQYDADIETLKIFMQTLEGTGSLDKFFVQQGVISLYRQLREEITPPRDMEEAWRRILITDSGDDQSSCDYTVSSDDTDAYE